MKDINKEAFSEFESGWQKAFEDAEMSPAKDIWNNIDAQLANKESKKYKKKVAYYKWLAAASVLFAIGLSYISLNNFNSTQYIANESKDQVTTENKLSENGADNASVLKGQQDNNGEELAGKSDSQNNAGLVLEQDSAEGNDSEQVEGSLLTAGGEALALQNPERNTTTDNTINNNAADAHNVEGMDKALEEEGGNPIVQNDDPDTMIGRSGDLLAGREEEENDLIVSALTEENNESLISNNTYPTGSEIEMSDASTSILSSLKGFSYHDKLHATLMEAPYIYSIPGVAIIKENEKAKNEASVLWAGLNLGSSLFDPNFQEGSNFQPQTSPALFSSMDNARESAPQEASFRESTDPGISYSLGVNFGVRLTERFILQSGVGYAQRRSSTNSTTYLQNNQNIAKTPAYLGGAKSDDGPNALSNVTQDYQLLNSFEFVSIPLKAGYLIVDRKIGIMILGGVSADVFLSNTLSESNDKIDEVKVEAGSGSPFRDVNFNGVIGAEFSYELSKNYHLTLEPNYGVALNSFTKSASNFSSNPQTFGLSAGLKFYLK